MKSFENEIANTSMPSRIKDMEKIVKGLSHLWRQPLTVFSFGLMNLKKRLKDDQQSLQIIEKLDKELNGMSSILQVYQEFYTPTYKKEHFDIYESVQKTKEVLRPLFEINNISFEIEVKENFVVYEYRYLFEQQLLEVMYSFTQGPITIIISNPKVELIDNQGQIVKNLL